MNIINRQTATDEALMASIRLRDHAAFRCFYERYESEMYTFLISNCGNRELSQDILQESFYKVWFFAGQFNPRRGSAKNWIYGIVRNMLRSEMGKKKYRYHHEDIWNEAIQPHMPRVAQEEQPDMHAEQIDRQEKIGIALAKLKPDLREIIILKQLQQLKFREIAHITGTPEGTLKARYQKALSSLKMYLGKLELI